MIAVCTFRAFVMACIQRFYLEEFIGGGSPEDVICTFRFLFRSCYSNPRRLHLHLLVVLWELTYHFAVTTPCLHNCTPLHNPYATNSFAIHTHGIQYLVDLHHNVQR